MAIDMTAFAPWSGLAGGALIGGAAAALALFNGRIAGISGIAGALAQPGRGDKAWRAAFVAGLVTAPLAYAAFRAPPALHIDASLARVVLAGLLVGAGTLYGSGCTSGHGVCGIARGSPRSMAATLSFVGLGMATVYVVRHLLPS